MTDGKPSTAQPETAPEAGLLEIESQLRKLTSSAASRDYPLAEAAPAAPSGAAASAAQPAVRPLAEFGGGADDALRHPFSVAVGPGGAVAVMDRPQKDHYRLSLFSPDGQRLATPLRCGKGAGVGELMYPSGVAMDTGGNFYVPDAGNNRVQRFGPEGAPLGALGSEGDAPGQFRFPCDVEVDASGAIYVADTGNSRVQKITSQGVPLLCIGSPDGPEASGAPEGADGLLEEPMGVTVDGAGCIYVADARLDRVIKYNPDGKAVWSLRGAGDGRFEGPSDVRVAADGSIYVADRDNSRVQRFDPGGKLLSSFDLQAQAREARGDVAIDDEGCLLICDLARHVVMKVAMPAASGAPAPKNGSPADGSAA